MMNVIKFKAELEDNFIAGVLIEYKNKDNVINFESNVYDLKEIVLKEKNIKDYGNFIASIINRVDSKAIFDSVDVEGKYFYVKRKDEKQKRMNIYIIKNSDGTKTALLKKDFDLLNKNNSVKDIFGKSVNLNLEHQVLEVPYNFEYSKNNYLNEVLKFSLAPYDYNRSRLSTSIIKTKKFVKNIIIKNMKRENFFEYYIAVEVSKTPRLIKKGQTLRKNGLYFDINKHHIL